MVTADQLHTNRLNALRSTGPRTPPGRARSSQNAIKAGLFSKALVLPAIGESADELDLFRAAVATDLGATDTVERELADRVAGLLWRLRRVARAEAAALSVPGAELPPHPDEVEYLRGDASLHPVPPGATASYRLSHVRTQRGFATQMLPERRAAVAALGCDTGPEEAIDAGAAYRVLFAACCELDWTVNPCPWGPALAAAGSRRRDVRRVRWTTGRMRRVLRCAAEGVGRDPVAFLAAVRGHLATELEALEQRLVEQRRLEADLVAVLLAEREAAAAARVCADDGLVQRIARAEAHLSRELDRALAQLTRLQSARREEGVGPKEFGFVLQNGPVAPPGVDPAPEVPAE